MIEEKEYIKSQTECFQEKTKDSLLWDSLKTGDKSALEILFKLYFSHLYDYGIKITRQDELVKDCVQDTFFYLWERHQYLSEVKSVKAYLMTCVRRGIFRALKRQNRRRQVFSLFAVENKGNESSFEELLVLKEIEKEQKNSIRSAFRVLPERMREALYLKNNQELSYKEISSVMKISPQVARNYVSEAYKKLRNILDSPLSN